MSADGKKSLKERKAEEDSPLVQPGTVSHGAVEQITPASRRRVGRVKFPRRKRAISKVGRASERGRSVGALSGPKISRSGGTVETSQAVTPRSARTVANYFFERFAQIFRGKLLL